MDRVVRLPIGCDRERFSISTNVIHRKMRTDTDTHLREGSEREVMRAVFARPVAAEKRVN